MNTIFNEFQKTPYLFDRIVTDTFNLPYSYNDIEIQPNELATANTFNIKIKKLYDNLIYMYGLCNIADFNLGTSYALISSNLTSITACRNAISYYSEQGIDNNNIIINDNNFIRIFGLDSNFIPSLISSQTLIDPVSGTLFFENITSVATDGENILYVADGTINNLYSYDLAGAAGDDFTRKSKLFLKDTIGGVGGRYEPLKFKNLNNIVFTGEVVITEDYGNKCFKVYDKNLNWLSTTVAITLFNTVTSFQSLAYNQKYSKLFGVKNNTLTIMDVGSNYSILSSVSYDYTDLLRPTERLIDVKIAQYDQDIFYLLTPERMFKKWITKPEYNIGVFANTNAKSNTFKWLTNTTSTSGNTVQIYSTTTNLSSNLLVGFEDSTNLISLLQDNYFNIYTMDDIGVNPEEYIQSWVYNKSIQKLMYNIAYFVSQISYRFFESLDEFNTPVFVRRGYSDFFLTTDPIDINNYTMVMVNENFQSSVLNRCLRKIYDLEVDILENIISNRSVVENLVPRRVRGPAFSLDFITYIAGPGNSISPVPIEMLLGSDAFSSPDNSIIIVSTAPYTTGAGISIL